MVADFNSQVQLLDIEKEISCDRYADAKKGKRSPIWPVRQDNR